jgi:hypothetical protein
MPETQDISRNAGEHFRVAAGFSFEDAGAHMLRYHLLRLTVVGLTEDDRKDLGELARLAFLESDVTDQVGEIKQRADASSLAFAIADLLDSAGGGVSGPLSLKAVMLGAVLGAYTSLRTLQNVDEPTVAILGAIGGAVAMSTGTFIVDNINRRSWDEYLRITEG